mmetsp:Transcript_41026/g.131186  ORF Transcript_41026/g.131186 Transcript_41026/m.131186 type:complete len:266 (-) Transcript_41026:479-1276(-)
MAPEEPAADPPQVLCPRVLAAPHAALDIGHGLRHVPRGARGGQGRDAPPGGGGGGHCLVARGAGPRGVQGEGRSIPEGGSIPRGGVRRVLLPAGPGVPACWDPEDQGRGGEGAVDAPVPQRGQLRVARRSPVCRPRIQARRGLADERNHRLDRPGERSPRVEAGRPLCGGGQQRRRPHGARAWARDRRARPGLPDERRPHRGLRAGRRRPDRLPRVHPRGPPRGQPRGARPAPHAETGALQPDERDPQGGALWDGGGCRDADGEA